MATAKNGVSAKAAHTAAAAAAVPSQQQRGQRRPLCHIHTPVGMMGYGFDEDLTRRELVRLTSTGVPTALILDSGSTDSGPQKLALGSMTSPRAAYAQDLSRLLRLCHEFRVPLIFGSAGGDGSDEHVREMGEIIKEICSEVGNEDYRIKTISLFAGIDKKTVMDRLDQGRLVGCGRCVPHATPDDIDASPRVVAQMGPEPFVDAMGAEPDFDVIVGGRAYDPAPYAAWCTHQLRLRRQKENKKDDDEIDPRVLGGFLHMGKIMECGGLCAVPKSPGATATVYPDGVFDVRPVAPGSRCTPTSVAAHSLYENTRPDVLRGPGGELRLGAAEYRQLPPRPAADNCDDDGELAKTVRVSGAVFVRPDAGSGGGRPGYTIKLEAARVVGYRAMTMGSVKDRVLISILDEVLAAVKAYVTKQHAGIINGDWDLGFHVYGREVAAAVSTGGLAGGGRSQGAVFIIAEALAPTQELANSIIAKARIAMVHAPYPGQKATSGNLGFGIGGLMEIEMGPCAEFSLYHLMDLEPGEERLALLGNGNGHAYPGGKEEGRGGNPQPLFRGKVDIYGSGGPPPKRAAVAQHPSAHDTAAVHPDHVVGNGSIQPSSGHPDRRSASPGGHSTGRVNGVASDKDVVDDAATTPRRTTPRRTTLFDLCQVLRSKNAGPYEITLDAIFASRDDYVRVRDSGLLSRQTVASALGVPEADIVWMGFWDPAAAFKVTIPRRRNRPGAKKSGAAAAAAGGFMEDDVHGSQEHLGLADIEIPPAVAVGADRRAALSSPA